VIMPLRDRKSKAGALHYFYSYIPYDSIYLDSGFSYGLDSQVTENGRPLICLAGTINHEIIFFSCNNFALMKSKLLHPGGDVAKTLDHFSSLIRSSGSDTKGLILDVRGNPGGDLADLNFLFGQLLDEPLLFGYVQYKRGTGKEDFTPWMKAFVNPESTQKKIEFPVVVLADVYSASLSESLVLAVRAFPNGKFLGETTWGATSPVVDRDVFQSGSFSIENFMEVRASSCRFKDLNGNIVETVGIAPDVEVLYTHDAYEAGIDLQLEKAIELLK
jgi:carboxyl-terminal processing protease